MSRRIVLAVVVLASACTPKAVDFTVDATTLAKNFPTALLTVDLVLNGDAVQHTELTLAVKSKVSFAGAITPVTDYGVAAFADIDHDGVCKPGTDLGWWIIYTPKPRVDFTWAPDPAVLRDDLSACTWFGDVTIVTDTGGDTDPGHDTDPGDDTDGG